VGPALRLSCRSELHVLPQFPVAQTIRSPDYDELSGPHRFLAVRAGVLWLGKPSRDLTPESLRGSESLRILPSVLPVTSLHETSFGFHRFEPVVGTMSPLSRAMLLTRQGISLGPYSVFVQKCTSHNGAKQRVPFTLLLHVAMQMGLYLHQRSASSSSAFGV
jgi:hypothetical protein